MVILWCCSYALYRMRPSFKLDSFNFDVIYHFVCVCLCSYVWLFHFKRFNSHNVTYIMAWTNVWPTKESVIYSMQRVIIVYVYECVCFYIYILYCLITCFKIIITLSSGLCAQNFDVRSRREKWKRTDNLEQ